MGDGGFLGVPKRRRRCSGIDASLTGTASNVEASISERGAAQKLENRRRIEDPDISPSRPISQAAALAWPYIGIDVRLAARSRLPVEAALATYSSHVDWGKDRIEISRAGEGGTGGREGSPQRYNVRAVGTQRQCFPRGEEAKAAKDSRGHDCPC